MQKIKLGKTGLKVTRLGLGGIQITKISTDRALNVIRTAMDLGIRFFETARGYSDSEEKIGKAIKPMRDKIVIATKASADSAEEMKLKIEQSLKALDVDYIDLYQYHGCDTRPTYEQILKPAGPLEAMIKAKDEGKIRAIGFSSHQPDLALEIMDDDIFSSAQLPISFMNTENHEKGLFKKAREKNVGLIAMKPFGGGRLENPRLCMGYVLSLPNVVAAVGTDSPEQVRDLVELADNPPILDENDKAEMQRIKDDIGTRFCRACNYCQPCPQNIKIFQILWLPVYLKQIGIKRTLTKEKIEMIQHSENCTQCRECEKRCPFNLDIVQNLSSCRAELQQLIDKQ